MIIITDLYLIKPRSMPPTCMHRQFLLIVALYIWVAKLISSSVTNKHNFLQRLLHESDPLDQCNSFQYILAVKYRLSANYRINPSAYTLNNLEHLKRFKCVITVTSVLINVISVQKWTLGVSRVQFTWTPRVQIWFWTLSAQNVSLANTCYTFNAKQSIRKH